MALAHNQGRRSDLKLAGMRAVGDHLFDSPAGRRSLGRFGLVALAFGAAQADDRAVEASDVGRFRLGPAVRLEFGFLGLDLNVSPGRTSGIPSTITFWPSWSSDLPGSRTLRSWNRSSGSTRAVTTLFLSSTTITRDAFLSLFQHRLFGNHKRAGIVADIHLELGVLAGEDGLIGIGHLGFHQDGRGRGIDGFIEEEHLPLVGVRSAGPECEASPSGRS